MKSKAFSLINIVGLAVGMATSILVIQYVAFEHSYDRHYDNSDRIYRVCHARYLDGALQYEKAQSFIPTGELLKNDYPEVVDYTTLFKISDQSEIVISYQKNKDELIKYNEENVYHVKGSFFKLFSVPILHGTANLDNLEPGTVLVSASTARKYFGTEIPLNRIIHHPYSGDFRVVGIYEDVPENSHFKPDFLFAWQSVTAQTQGGDLNNWHWDGFYTYIMLANGTAAATLESKLDSFATKYLSKASDRIGESRFWLQPLHDIHLNSHLLGEAEVNGNGTVVNILKALAIFVLIIAYINYINLSSAKAIDRAREIGLRKIIGSRRRQLIAQFLLESILVNFLAATLALGMVFSINTYYQDLIGISEAYNLFGNEQFWMGFISLVVVGSLCAGLYPAVVVSSFKPVEALKGNRPILKFGSVAVRRVLVTFQFVLSIILITVSAVIYKQIKFMKTQDLGIAIDQTIVLRTFIQFGPPGSDSVFMDKLVALQNQLQNNPRIKGTAASYDIPGKEHQSLFSNFRHVSGNGDLVSLYVSRIDYDFIPLFEAKVVAGRNFSRSSKSDEEAVVVNLQALEALGFSTPVDAIDREIVFGRDPNPRKAKIIGVVDFRSTSYKEKNYPVAYQTNWAPLRFLSIRLDRLNTKEVENTITSLKQQWAKLFPEAPFDYFFLDDFFNKQYEAEQKFNDKLFIFTGLALFVACLGLYGLSILVSSQRTKEIAIRKILGASIKSLFLLLSRDFGLLIIVAGSVSFPINWYFASQWLERFEYRTELSWWLFAIAFFVLALIVLMTVGLQSLKTLLVNPVKSLRSE